MGFLRGADHSFREPDGAGLTARSREVALELHTRPLAMAARSGVVWLPQGQTGGMMSQQAGSAEGQADYDRSGRWPVAADGWQVIFLGRLLFAGGPFACKAVAPTVSFFFGLHFEPGAAAPGPQTAVITNFGRPVPKPSGQWALTEHEKLHARRHVAAYLMANAALFRREPIVNVEFRDGDGRQLDVM